MLIVVVIIVILAGLGFGLTGAIKKRAERGKCISHMRSLHGAFAGFMSDYGHWPQLSDVGSEAEHDEFWINVLTPYGGTWDVWLCPTHKRLIAQEQALPKKEEGEGEPPEFGKVTSYMPTPFDSKPNRPYQWLQPWLVEKGDHHGGGAQILMPDGSVKRIDDYFNQ